MDELYEELQKFLQTLRLFNEVTSMNWDALQEAWDHANELWRDDATRRQFENDWQEMGTALRLYREKYAERYEEFLQRRKWALDEYFGHR